MIHQRIVITSGFFNPIHEGHLSLLKEAKKLGDKLVVIVNNDEQVKIKGSKPFWNERFRVDLINSLEFVDEVVLSIDKTISIAKTIESIYDSYHINDNGIGVINGIFCLENTSIDFIFAKGGDRKDASCMPESELAVCQKYDVEVIYGVGGFDKKNSSSEILKGII